MTDGIRHTVQILSPPDDITTVHQWVRSVWDRSPEIGEEERYRFELALVELATNVIRHADPGTGVECTLTIETLPHELRATLSDTGVSGDIQLVDREMPDPSAESGRGIPIIQALVDELSFDHSDGLNHWHISRRLAD
jgi:serine/threonine-protein kinase RsbW